MNNYILMIVVLLMFSCQAPQAPKSKYLRWVGDIAYDANVDSPTFTICNEDHVPQYFNFSKGMQYLGEKPALVAEVNRRYKPVNVNQSGLVRIRFVVNCKGKTGRFRMQAMDWDYQPHEFDSQITDQLLTITKSLSGWEKLTNNTNPKDYYQYLIFKIDNGALIEILP